MKETEFIEEVQGRGSSFYILLPKDKAEEAGLKEGDACGVRVVRVESPFKKSAQTDKQELPHE